MSDPDVIEVEVERLGEAQTRGERIRRKVWRVVLPVVLAMLVDAGDIATFGPLGLVAMPAGMLVGYLFAGYLEVSPTWRVVITIVTGVYWALPLNFIPLATVVAAVVQLVKPDVLQTEPFQGPRGGGGG